jgi:hypothetical protein
MSKLCQRSFASTGFVFGDASDSVSSSTDSAVVVALEAITGLGVVVFLDLCFFVDLDVEFRGLKVVVGGIDKIVVKLTEEVTFGVARSFEATQRRPTKKTREWAWTKRRIPVRRVRRRCLVAISRKAVGIAKVSGGGDAGTRRSGGSVEGSSISVWRALSSSIHTDY